MYRYALLDSTDRVLGFVESEGVLNDKRAALADKNTLPGSLYDRIEKRFIGGEVARIREITKGAFYARLSMPEKVALEASADPTVKVFMKTLDYRGHVDLDFAETVEGVDYLIGAGLLAPERRAALLADGTQAEAWEG